MAANPSEFNTSVNTLGDQAFGVSPPAIVAEKRQHPRYPVRTRLNLAVEDEGLGESIGIAEADDVSIGGVRIRHLPAHTAVRVGSRLGLLLMGEDDVLSLHGEVVHHGAADSFGIKFTHISAAEQQRMRVFLGTLYG